MQANGFHNPPDVPACAPLFSKGSTAALVLPSGPAPWRPAREGTGMVSAPLSSAVANQTGSCRRSRDRLALCRHCRRDHPIQTRKSATRQASARALPSSPVLRPFGCLRPLPGGSAEGVGTGNVVSTLRAGSAFASSAGRTGNNENKSEINAPYQSARTIPRKSCAILIKSVSIH